MAGCGCCEQPCGCVNVTFHSVAIDCGCQSAAPIGPTHSSLYTDISFNETPYLLTIGSIVCSTCYRHVFNPSVSIDDKEWNHVTDCSGPPDHHFTVTPINIYLTLISGIYYLMAVQPGSAGGQTIFFYGTTTDLSSPIVNTSFCTTPITWDNPLIECINGGSITAFGAGHNGTATIEATTCP